MAVKCPECQTENTPDSQFCKKCATPLPVSEQVSITKTLETPVKKLSKGTTFADRYEILEELGKGGMGEVYKVRDKKLDEDMALKVLRPDIAADKGMIERFKNELKLARKIGHKHVCRMFDLNEEEETPYITMEYVQGEDLKSFIMGKGKLTEKEALTITKQVCEGLAGAHELGVVHRDLKPQNIMIDDRNNAKIMDFGIARSVMAPGVTATGMIIGTPDYISPEQAEGEEADQRSDIYSLGVILYEMVTGGVPFKGDTAFSVALKHKTQLPQDPRKLNPEVSESLSRLILVCMEKDRERRYQSAGAVLDDLRNIEEGLPLGTKVRPRGSSFIQTLIRKNLLIPVLAVTFAFIGVIVWQLLPQKEALMAPKIENSIAVISFENQTGDKAFDHLQKVIPNLLITNLENTGFFHVATGERMRDLLKQMDRDEVEIITSDLGFQACQREGITALALGSYTKIGETFVTDIKVLDVESKRLLKSASSRGEGEESIFAQIDELSVKISEGMGISSQQIEEAKLDISGVTTSSLEAYKHYLKGIEDHEKFYYAEARQSFEKAVILDPEFAMAYLYLAYDTGYGEAKNEAFKNAMTYAKKATEKERLYIEASYASYIEQDSEKRFRIHQQITDKYPQEKQAHYQLGLYFQYQRKNLDRALEEYNKVLKLDPEHGKALNYLGYVYSDLGDFEKAIEVFKKYASVSPGEANPLDCLADIYFKMGRLEDCEATHIHALEIKPDWFASYVDISYIKALREDYSEAIKWVDKGIDTFRQAPASQALLLQLKGFYYFWLGRMDQSLRETRTAWVLADSAGNDLVKSYSDRLEEWVYHQQGRYELARKSLKNHLDFFINYAPSVNFKIVENLEYGLFELKEGKYESVKARLDEIESLLPQITPASDKNLFTVFIDLLNTEILLAEGALEDAASLNKKVTFDFLPGIKGIIRNNVHIYKDALARIYRQKGELDNAIVEYERLVTFNPKSKDKRLIHPLYYYRLAKLYEERGWLGQAVEKYERFLDLWKDADPGLAEVEDAQKRLAGLKVQ